MAKKEHVKPVGVDGSLTHVSGPDIDERTFNRHVAPKAKNLIEDDIARAFKRLISTNPESAAQLTQLPENDLDFIWSIGDREAKIEFTELTLTTPPYREKGQSAIIHYKPWAEKFCALVDKKNAKSYRETMAIDLLVYTTHFAYHGNSFCVDLAADRLRHAEGGSSFDRIYYLEFRKEASSLYILKPYREKLTRAVRVEYEGHWYSNMNFEEGTPVPGGTMYQIDLPKQS